MLICFYTNIPAELFGKLVVAPEIQKADAVVVLGAGVTQTGWPGRFSLERAVEGIILYKKGEASKIIFTGGWDHDGLISSAEAMAKIAKELGVAEEDIFVEKDSHNTYENALFTNKILLDNNLHSVLLVTSESHMKRSLAIFKKMGVNAYPAPVNEFIVNDKMDWKSKIHNFSLLYQFFYESFGVVKYKINGWV